MGPEARIPCPTCGGPIHPVAGRCKHCKTDLVAERTGTARGRSTVPSLGNRTANERGVAGRRPSGHAAIGRPVLPRVEPSMTTPFGMGSAIPSSVLPIGRTAEPPASWATIVIAMAAAAIVVATGVLVYQLS